MQEESPSAIHRLTEALQAIDRQRQFAQYQLDCTEDLSVAFKSLDNIALHTQTALQCLAELQQKQEPIITKPEVHTDKMYTFSFTVNGSADVYGEDADSAKETLGDLIDFMGIYDPFVSGVTIFEDTIDLEHEPDEDENEEEESEE